MLKSLFCRVLTVKALAIAVLCSCLTNAAEIDNGLYIEDREPWRISWVNESENRWVLVANFDKGELRTYFKKAPPSKGFGLSSANKPIKQEFKYYPLGKTFTSRECQFEQWPNGTKAYAFIYSDKFKMDNKKLCQGPTVIMEDIDNIPSEISYCFGPVFE